MRAAGAAAAAVGICLLLAWGVHWAFVSSEQLAAQSLLHPETAMLRPGAIPLDATGEEVQAHGGQLIQLGRTFYWVGTSRKVAPWWISWAINIYSSQDLRTWRFRGVIFSQKQVLGFPGRWRPYGHLNAPPPPLRMERPKILHHRRGDYFVLMFHLDTPGFEVPAVGVATSQTITGPFTWRHAIFPDDNTSYDMTVHEDSRTGEAFLVRSCPVMTVAVSRLRPDWLDVEGGGPCSRTGRGEEGPAVFEWGGTHYLFTSHLTGWAPNMPLLHRSTGGGMCSTFWQDMQTPASGPGGDTTYAAQSSFAYPYRFEDGSRLLLWMGDRWNAAGPGGIANASYVWLPLLPRLDGLGFELVNAEAWSLAQYKGAAFDPGQQRVVFAAERAALASSGHAAALPGTAVDTAQGADALHASQPDPPNKGSSSSNSGGMEVESGSTAQADPPSSLADLAASRAAFSQRASTRLHTTS